MFYLSYIAHSVIINHNKYKHTGAKSVPQLSQRWKKDSESWQKTFKYTKIKNSDTFITFLLIFLFRLFLNDVIMFYVQHICMISVVFLWSPYGIGQTIIFLPCGFFFLFFLA